MQKKKKAVKPLYDAQGRWVEERGRIKGAVRRAFRQSPQLKDVLYSARIELPPKIKKDGTLGKRPQVRYTCAMCKELYQQKNVQVDHKQTVVPLWKSETSMTLKEWASVIVTNIFCPKENLQVLCSTSMKDNNGNPSCHKVKTDKENWIRRRFKELEQPVKNENTYLKIFNKEYLEYLLIKEEKKKKADERKRNRANKKR